MTNEEFPKLLLQKLDSIASKIGSMETRIDAIETKIGAMDEQLNENTQIIKGLMHRTEEINAELRNQGHILQHVYGQVNVLDEKVTRFGEQLYNLADDASFLVRKAAEHDKAIRRLYPIK